MTYSGGCQCGQVRYEINSAPGLAYCCHCTDCQQQSSSAFGMSVWFPADAFKLTSGELAVWKTKGDSGAEKICSFCRECGSRIHHAFAGETDMVTVKGGSLDDICAITPIAHIWTRSAQPWLLAVLESKMCFETEPDSFDGLIAQFQAAST